MAGGGLADPVEVQVQHDEVDVRPPGKEFAVVLECAGHPVHGQQRAQPFADDGVVIDHGDRRLRGGIGVHQGPSGEVMVIRVPSPGAESRATANPASVRARPACVLSP